MLGQECSGSIDLLERLIDQSIIRRLDPFVAKLFTTALLIALLFIERVHKRELDIGVFFSTHAADCTRERSDRGTTLRPSAREHAIQRMPPASVLGVNAYC